MLKRRPEPSRPRGEDERPAAGPWLLLFVIAFALRALVAWMAPGPVEPPARIAALDTVAWNLSQGAGFSLTGPEGAIPTASVPPLTPWMTSLVYRVAGHRHPLALLLQAVLGALAVLFLAWFGASVAGGTTGRLAGWIAAFDPLLVGASRWNTPETALPAFLLIALGTTAAWVKTPRPGRALGAGLAWGLAALAHDAALALPVIALVWAWVPLGLTVTSSDRNRQVLLVLVGAVVIILPWTIRNLVVMRAPVVITTRSGLALLEGNNLQAWSRPDTRGAGVDITRVEPHASELAGLGEARADRVARSRALAMIAARARDWPTLAAARAARLWRITSERAMPGGLPPADPTVGAIVARVDLIAVSALVLFPLALWGTARILVSARRWYQSLALLVLACATLIAVAFHGSLLARVPIEPLVALLAAMGFEDARRRLRSQHLGLRVVHGRR